MNKKLKIAIIGSRGYPYVYSGYETLVKELSERLVKKGHCVRIYCHRSLFKKKPKYLNGIELVYTPSIETKFLSQFINSFFSTIHFCFSDYRIGLYVNSANGPFGLFTKIFNKKTCINVDGLELLRPKWKGFGSLYFKISSKLSLIFFHKIITDSVEMKKIYKKKYNSDSDVIAYGSTMVTTQKKRFLKELNLKKDEYYLIVGRLIPDNNAKLIVDGFIKSKSKKKLVIVGDVPYFDNYANELKSLANDHLIFTGYVKCQERLSQLYINCYAYIHGHEFGGTNPTMINALFLRCQILALRTSFNKEMLQNMSVVYFEKYSKSVCSSLLLFEKKYNKLNVANKNYFFPLKYDWEFISNKYLKTFFNLTNFQNK